MCELGIGEVTSNKLLRVIGSSTVNLVICLTNASYSIAEIWFFRRINEEISNKQHIV